MFDRVSRQALPLAALAAILAHGGPAEAQTWRTFTSARQAWDQEPLAVHVQYGVGELSVAPANEPLLYQMELRYDEDSFTPLTEFDAQRRVLRLGTQGREGRGNTRLREGSRASITLTRTVPLDLDLDFGAGEAEIDLGGVSLRNLELSTGASEARVRFSAPNPVRAERVHIQAGAADLEVHGLGNARAARYGFEGGVGSTLLDFGGAWDRSAAVSVEMGVGSLVLRLPRGVGVRIDLDSFLTSFDATGLTRRGGSYYSSDWESAAHRLTIGIDAAFGSIKVEWID